MNKNGKPSQYHKYFLKSLHPNMPYFLEFSLRGGSKDLMKENHRFIRGQKEDKFISFQEKMVATNSWKIVEWATHVSIERRMGPGGWYEPTCTGPWWRGDVAEALSQSWRTSVDEKIRENLQIFHEGMRFHMKCPPWKTNPHSFTSPSILPYPFCPYSPFLFIVASVCLLVLHLNS